MSSQGPGNTTPGSGFPFATGPNAGTPVAALSYPFTSAAIRDGSDWIAFKKQMLIYNETKSKINQDPWFSRGNDYRIQFLLGKYKREAGGCSACSGGAFSENGPY